MDIANSRKDVTGETSQSNYVFDGAMAKITSAFSTTTGVTFSASFTATNFDTGSYWSVANPTRLTVTNAGKYLCAGYLRYAANGTGARRIEIRRNDGVDVVLETQASLGSTMVHSFAKGGQLDFTAGQYIELRGVQTSGGNLDVEAAYLIIWKMP